MLSPVGPGKQPGGPVARPVGPALGPDGASRPTVRRPDGTGARAGFDRVGRRLARSAGWPLPPFFFFFFHFFFNIKCSRTPIRMKPILFER